MKTIIFTDGASRENPGNGGWGAIILDDGKVTEIGGYEKDTTNNRMEMVAVISALQKVSGNNEIEIYTDSAYVVNGITKWIFGWQKNNWQTKAKKEVMNVDIWQELVDVARDKKIQWKRLSGHSGVPANERCDVIATSFADGRPINLFKGDISDYKIDLSVIEGTAKAQKEKSRTKTTAYSYVSFVNGGIHIDTNWADCEARVKGVSGARFKKAVSEIDEAEIVAEFSKYT